LNDFVENHQADAVKQYEEEKISESKVFGARGQQWGALPLAVRQACVHSLMEQWGQKILDSISHESIRL